MNRFRPAVLAATSLVSFISLLLILVAGTNRSGVSSSAGVTAVSSTPTGHTSGAIGGSGGPAGAATTGKASLGDEFCTPEAAGETAAPTRTGATVTIHDEGYAGVIRNADLLAANGEVAAAKELYVGVLNAASADPVARKCAAAGLARIAFDIEDEESTGVSDLETSWTEFADHYLTPLWSLLLPFVATIAILLLLAKGASRYFVGPSSTGTTDGDKVCNAWLYALCGWGQMILAACLVVGIAPAVEGWPTGIGIVVVAGAWVVIAAAAFVARWRLGRLDDQTASKILRTHWLLILVVVATLAAAGISYVIGGPLAPTLMVAALAAAVGVFVVGYLRGLRQEMTIEGKKDDGTDGPGIAQMVQVALTGVGAKPPRGAMTPVNTDCSSLQKDALAILPDGSWAKIANFLLSLVTPSRPWRVQVSRIDEMTISVALFRNGRPVESQVIRPVNYGWQATAETTAGGAGKADTTQAKGADTAGDGAVDLCRAAAAYIVLVMSQRHRELKDGLNGATKWASVAAQVVATMPRSKELTRPQKVSLLSTAVALDNENFTARLALVIEQSARTANTNAELVSGLDALFALFERIKSQELSAKSRFDEWAEPFRALQLRMLFSMTVALSNDYLAAGGDSTAKREPAATYSLALNGLIPMYDRAGSPLHDLITEIRSCSYFLGDILNTNERQQHPGIVGALGYYEAACAAAFRAQELTAKQSSTKESLAEWSRALDLLDVAASADPSNATWAQDDPSFRRFRVGFSENLWRTDDPAGATDSPSFLQLQRFRTIVGSPGPTTFFALEGIAPVAEMLQGLGITSAQALRDQGAYRLAGELTVSSSTAQRCIDIAELYVSLPPPRRSITHLFLQVEVSSVDVLKDQLADHARREKLAENLADKAVGVDIVPPTAAALTALAAFL